MITENNHSNLTRQKNIKNKVFTKINKFFQLIIYNIQNFFEIFCRDYDEISARSFIRTFPNGRLIFKFQSELF